MYHLVISNGTPDTFPSLSYTNDEDYPGGDLWLWDHTYDSVWTGPEDGHDLAFRIFSANEDPVLVTNAGLTLDEGASATIANTNLLATDADGDTITYTIGPPPVNGTLKKGEATLVAGGAFTQAEMDAGILSYVHNGSETTSDDFTFIVSDGYGGSIAQILTITINPVNDPPTFNLGGNVTRLEDSGTYSQDNFLTGLSAVESGQTLTTTVSNSDNALFAARPAIDGTGRLTFTPAANAYGTATVTVTVTDNGGTANGGQDSTTKTFTITITGVNDRPSFKKGPDQIVNEEAGAQTVSKWATGISAGPNESTQTVSFEVNTDYMGLFTDDGQPKVSPTGTLTFTPAADANGAATVTVWAVDDGDTANGGNNRSALQTFTIIVVSVNDPPVAKNDVDFGTWEDSGEIRILANLLANDSAGPDDEDQTLIITGFANGTGGTVRYDGSNIYFTPAANFHGNAHFYYTVSDDAGGTATATVTVPVSPVADTPTVTSKTIDEDTSASGLVIGRNAVDGGEVTHFQITWTAPIRGTLKLNDGTTIINGKWYEFAEGLKGLSFTPDPDANGTFTFTVAAATSGAGSGKSDTITFDVTVTARNDAPEAHDDNLLGAFEEEDGPWEFPLADLTDNDFDGPATATDERAAKTLTVIAVGGVDGAATGGTVTLDEAREVVIFTPTEHYNGDAAFTYTVQDSGGATAAATARFTITQVNDDPEGTDEVLCAVDEDSGIRTIAIADLLANDRPGPAGAPGEGDQELFIVAVTAVEGATKVEIEDGAVRFHLEPNFHGTATFTYTLQDSGTPALTDEVTVSFPVNSVAEAPTVSPATTLEETMTDADLEITPDALDGDAVTHYFIAGITGGWLYKNDGTTLITKDRPITAAEGAAGLKFMPLANLNTAAGDTFEFTVAAALDEAGTGMSPGTPVTITVTAVNDAPSFAPGGNQTVDEDAGTKTVANWATAISPGFNEFTQTVSFEVTNENTALFTVGGQPAIDANGTLTFTLAPNAFGTAEVTVTAKDTGGTSHNGSNESLPQTFIITVDAVNDAPTFTLGTDVVTVLEDSAAYAAASFLTDRDAVEAGQTLTLTVSIADDDKGLFTAEPAIDDDGKLTFTPAPDAYGTAVVKVMLKDDGGTARSGEDTTTKRFSITITGVNDAPVAEDQSLSVIGGATLRGTVKATDVENDPLTYAVVDAPTQGTVTMNADGTFAYVSRRSGSDSFTFKANDGSLDSEVATVTVTISEAPSVPVPSGPPPLVPVLTISGPVAETRESNMLVSGTANPGYSVTVAGKNVLADSQGNWSATVTLAEGPNVITAAHSGLTQSVTVVRDTTPPALTLTPSSTRTEAETVALTATANEEGAKITIEGQETATLTVQLKLGQNQFSATATDRLGNSSSATVSVLREGKVLPVLQEIAPGEPGEAAMLNFQVQLPGETTTEPLLLQILSPSADTAAISLATGAAEVVGTGDGELTSQADGTPVSQLTATVTFEYDPEAVADPAALRIYYFDTKHNVWVEIGGVVDSQTHTITVQVGHFTTFAALVPQAEAPVLRELPAEVHSDKLTVSGTAAAERPVSLIINGESQVTVMTDKNGRYTMEGTLAEGRNWVYVKGTDALASREYAVTFRLYTDIGGHWAEGTINRLARLRIVTVYPSPHFAPEAKVTRLEFAVMVARVLGLTPVNEAPAFTDTESMPGWARPEVAAAVRAGIIKGMPDGSFAPDRLVNRAEMAIMLTRALGYAGKDITAGNHRFADEEEIPDWAKDQVYAAARWGLITGYPDGSFQPAHDTTRAEAATMLGRLLDQVSK